MVHKFRVPLGFFVLLLISFIVTVNRTVAQAPTPLPPKENNVAILVVDDFGDPFPMSDSEGLQTDPIDCLLLHTIDPGGNSQQGQASRSLGMASRSLGMTDDETNITVPHGKFVFTQFVDFAEANAYDDLALEKYVLEAFLNGGNNFTRYAYPTSHTLAGLIPTNPNGIEFSGFDLIPVHANGENADNLDENLTDAVSRTLALGYSHVIVNMSFGFFDCDNVESYINNPTATVDETALSNFHSAVTNLKTSYPNVIFVGASGNFSKGSPFAPAVWDEVISVGAYDTIDTVANLSERELFIAKRTVPATYYANRGSILMPGSWGDNTQNNLTFTGATTHKVRFEGTSFAAPWLSMYLAQYLNRSGSQCNASSFPDDVDSTLITDWSGTPQTSRPIEEIVRSYTCPELNASTYNPVSKTLEFTIYSSTPSLSLAVTSPTNGATVGSTFNIAGHVIDQNAGSGNGDGVALIRIYHNPGSPGCSGTVLTPANFKTFSAYNQPAYDVTYDNSGFTLQLENKPAGSYTFTVCAESRLNYPAMATASQTITVTIDPAIDLCADTSFPMTATTAQQLIIGMTCANLNGTADTINLGANIELTVANNLNAGSNGLPVINSPITINGNGYALKRWWLAPANFRLFHVGTGGNLTLNNVSLAWGVSDSGGAIYNENGTVTLNDAYVYSNTAYSYGGAFTNVGIMTLNDTTVNNNTSSYAGGGIANFGTLTINNGTLRLNVVHNLGGAIYSDGGSVTINDSYIGQNSMINPSYSDDGGGGIYSTDELFINRSTIAENTAAHHGGGLVTQGNATLIDTILEKNKSDFQGGGIYSLYSEIALMNTIVRGNDALDSGGGLYIEQGLATVWNSVFSGNHAEYTAGGAIHNQGDLDLRNSTIAGNYAAYGSGIYNASNLGIYNTVVWGNSYEGGYSQIYNDGFIDGDRDAMEDGAFDGVGTDSISNVMALGDPEIIFYAPLRAENYNTPNVLGDYHLAIGSVLFEQGDSSYLLEDIYDVDYDLDNNEQLPIDADGNNRIRGGEVDIGAYESFGECPVSPFYEVAANAADFVLLVECAETQGIDEDTIELAGTISLHLSNNDTNGYNGVPALSTPLVIVGNNHIIERNNYAPDYFRLFYIAPGGSLYLNNLTLRNGYNETYGGAIYADGGLVLEKVSVLNNHATYYGGGLYTENADFVEINNSIFSGNHVGTEGDGEGGAIYINGGSMTVKNSMFTGNFAQYDGGAIFNVGEITMSNSTISGNYANGWGGGIYNDGSGMTFNNSILWGNDAGGGYPQVVNFSPFNVAYSGIQELSSIVGVSNNGGTIDLGADATIFINPQNANDAPTTAGDYHLAGSAVINAGNNALIPSGLTTDIDGNARIQQGTVDMGADEVNWCSGISFPYTATTVSTLRKAIHCANVSPDTNTIKLGNNITLASIYNTIDGNNGLPSITTPIIIGGQGYTLARSNASSDTFRIFHVAASGNLQLFNVTISNGVANGASFPTTAGGAIFSKGTVTLNNTTLSGNSAASTGGGIDNSSGTLTVTNSTIAGNSANDGGGISTGGTTTIIASTISSNSTISAGGGIFNGGPLTVTGSTINNNSAGIHGGGIYNNNIATLSITGSIFTGNSATGSGGGLFNDSLATVDNSTLSSNSAQWGAGANNHTDGTLTITNSTLSGNVATWGGGGIHNFNTGTLTVTGSTLTGNTANRGGGIDNVSTGPVTVTNSTFTNNSVVTDGGGIFNDTSSTITVNQSTFTGNSANGFGGGIRNWGMLTVRNSTFRGNTTGTDGGGITNGGTATVTNSIITGNKVVRWGGGISNGGPLTVTNSTISGNLADTNGGGIYNNSAGTVTLNNNIVWGNNAPTDAQIDNNNTLIVENTAIQNFAAVSVTTNNGGNLSPGSGATIFVAPQPASNAPTTAGNYHLANFSPVINQGKNSLIPVGVTTDIDGDARILENIVDMGADEINSCGSLNFPITVMNATELRITIICANGTPATDTINLGGTISLTDIHNGVDGNNGLPSITTPIVIDGKGFALERSNAISATFRLLHVDTAGKLELRNIRLRNGSAQNTAAGSDDEYGGGIYSRGTLTLINTIVSGNRSNLAGGGIYTINGNMRLRNSTIVGNFANYGGGIRSDTTPLTIENSVIWGNYATTGASQLINKVAATSIASSAIENLASVAYTNNGGNIDLSQSATIFVNPQNASLAPTSLGDYHLHEASVVANKGSAALVPVGLITDFEGQARVIGVTVDMGADEHPFPLPPTDTNLIYNPGFTLGVNFDAGWTATGSLIKQVTNGVMKLRFPTTVNGWLRQLRAAYPLRNNLKMEATVQVSNPSASSKQFQFMLRDSDLSNTYLCTFTLPANAPMRTYTVQFKTLTNWEIIEIDVRPNQADAIGLLFDNVSLMYKPSLTLTQNQLCIDPILPPLPPVDSNLIYNPDFNIGVNKDAGWRYEGNILHAVVNEVMNLHFASSVNGWLRQYRTVYPLQAQLKMIAWVNVSNPNNVQKTFQLMFRDSDLSNTYLCNFTVPANAPARNYYMRFKTLTDWEIIEVDMRPNVVDVNGLNFDTVNLRYRPYLTFTVNQECIPPIFDEAPMPPPDAELAQK